MLNILQPPVLCEKLFQNRRLVLHRRNMATLKTISVRVKSLESTKKITQSMKMVAASK